MLKDEGVHRGSIYATNCKCALDQCTLAAPLYKCKGECWCTLGTRTYRPHYCDCVKKYCTEDRASNTLECEGTASIAACKCTPEI